MHRTIINTLSQYLPKTVSAAMPRPDQEEKNEASKQYSLDELFEAINKADQELLEKIALAQPDLFFEPAAKVIPGPGVRQFGAGTTGLQLLIWSGDPGIKSILNKLEGTIIEVAPYGILRDQEQKEIANKEKILLSAEGNGVRLHYFTENGKYEQIVIQNSIIRNILQNSEYAPAVPHERMPDNSLSVQALEALHTFIKNSPGSLGGFYLSPSMQTTIKLLDHCIDRALKYKRKIFEAFQQYNNSQGLLNYLPATGWVHQPYCDFRPLFQVLDHCRHQQLTDDRQKRTLLTSYNEALQNVPMWIPQYIYSTRPDFSNMSFFLFDQSSLSYNFKGANTQSIDVYQKNGRLASGMCWAEMMRNNQNSSSDNMYGLWWWFSTHDSRSDYWENAKAYLRESADFTYELYEDIHRSFQALDHVIQTMNQRLKDRILKPSQPVRACEFKGNDEANLTAVFKAQEERESAKAALAAREAQLTHNRVYKDFELKTQLGITIPPGYVCRKSSILMIDPVICKLDGYTYERSYILEYLQKFKCSPSNSFLRMGVHQSVNDVLKPNVSLREAIEEFRSEHNITDDKLYKERLAPTPPTPAVTKVATP